MKNAIPPTLAPRISRSAPFGSPRGSKHQRVHRFPSPNTTPDDDQDQPTKKKRRTSIKKGPQAAYHANNSDDNFDQIIQEDRNLHFNERNNKIAAPSPQGTNISHRATTPTKMAAKMQATSPTTPTTLTTTDDNKKGTTTEPDDHTTKHYASTNANYKDIGPTDDNEEDSNNHRTTSTTTTNISTKSTFNNMAPKSTTNVAHSDAATQTPTQELVSPLRFPRSAGIALADFIPVVTLARRDPKSIHTTIRRRCNTFPKPFWNRSMTHSQFFPYLSLHHVDADDSRPSSLAPPQLADPNSDHHLPNFHSNLKWDVIDLARYIRQINAFTEDEVPINTSYTLGTIQDDVDKVIRATADEHVKSLQNTLTMIAHALVRHTTRCQAPQYNLLSHHSKFERIRSDRSRETTVQSSKSHFGTLVGADNSADSRLKTMTSDENTTSPTFYELYPEYSPCSFPESDPEPTRDDNSTTLDSVSKFSTSSPIPDVVLEISDSVKRPVNGPNASLSYCAAVDTGNAATVVRTAVSSPNPQQWACRAHNPTVSSETLTYLDVQHPVPIKLEDLPSSQADDADVFLADHCYSCSNNDSTRETVNFYPDADPDPLPEVANDPDPEPMDIVEDDLDNNGDANRDIGEPNEVPSAAIQQLVRLLPPLRPAPPLRYANPLDAIHHHPFRMFQHFHHIPSRDLFFTEAMLMDTINGTIHLRDLPLCVRTSATISAFASTHSPTHPNSTSSVASTSTSSTTSYFTSYATTCISTN
ncbi:hypothetical protein MHU86_13569 [Fragilaria crotonensis]|nr:hypothetical protein MHU86_13569 [Fragilaria crotonensis]